MEIVKEPHLRKLRSEVSELQRLVDGDPNEQSVTQAWAAFGRIKEVLAELCPNHPEIAWHFR